MIFQWTERNREHLEKHAVEPEEAEYVASEAEPPFPRAIEDEKMLVWGQTEAGRYLQVIFVYLDDEEVDYESLSVLDRIRFEEGEEVGLVIHAMNMTDAQKRQYRRLLRR